MEPGEEAPSCGADDMDIDYYEAPAPPQTPGLLLHVLLGELPTDGGRRERSPAAGASMDAAIWSRLPDDALTTVVSRLPFRSKARFRCVSRVWRTLLSSPMILAGSSTGFPRLCGLQYSHTAAAAEQEQELQQPGVPVPVPGATLHLDLAFLPAEFRNWEMVAGGDVGLVVLANLNLTTSLGGGGGGSDGSVGVGTQLCVFNPLTRWWRHLPPPGLPTTLLEKVLVTRSTTNGGAGAAGFQLYAIFSCRMGQSRTTVAHYHSSTTTWHLYELESPHFPMLRHDHYALLNGTQLQLFHLRTFGPGGGTGGGGGGAAAPPDAHLTMFRLPHHHHHHHQQADGNRPATLVIRGTEVAPPEATAALGTVAHLTSRNYLTSCAGQLYVVRPMVHPVGKLHVEVWKRNPRMKRKWCHVARGRPLANPDGSSVWTAAVGQRSVFSAGHVIYLALPYNLHAFDVRECSWESRVWPRGRLPRDLFIVAPNLDPLPPACFFFFFLLPE